MQADITTNLDQRQQLRYRGYEGVTAIYCVSSPPCCSLERVLKPNNISHWELTVLQQLKRLLGVVISYKSSLSDAESSSLEVFPPTPIPAKTSLVLVALISLNPVQL